MTIGREPLCRRCVRDLEWRATHPDDEGMRCAAFPKGIPDSILNGEADHTKPVPGDNGIRFKAATPADLERLVMRN